MVEDFSRFRSCESGRPWYVVVGVFTPPNDWQAEKYGVLRPGSWSVEVRENDLKVAEGGGGEIAEPRKRVDHVV